MGMGLVAGALTWGHSIMYIRSELAYEGEHTLALVAESPNAYAVTWLHSQPFFWKQRRHWIVILEAKVFASYWPHETD